MEPCTWLSCKNWKSCYINKVYVILVIPPEICLWSIHLCVHMCMCILNTYKLAPRHNINVSIYTFTSMDGKNGSVRTKKSMNIFDNSTLAISANIPLGKIPSWRVVYFIDIYSSWSEEQRDNFKHTRNSLVLGSFTMRKNKWQPKDSCGHGGCILQLLILIILMVCIIFNLLLHLYNCIISVP